MKRTILAALLGDDLTVSVADAGEKPEPPEKDDPAGGEDPDGADDELERAIRERLGAGDLPEEAQRSAIERTVSASGGIAALAEAARRRRSAKD